MASGAPNERVATVPAMVIHTVDNFEYVCVPPPRVNLHRLPTARRRIFNESH